MAEKNFEIANANIYSTFQNMGLRTEKGVAKHLLLENTYQNNLVCDISEVDYTEHNLGPTTLQPLEGLPLFVDDLYIYSYLARNQVVYVGKRVSLSTGEQGFAKNVVAKIQTCIGAAFGPNKHLHTTIVHTVPYLSKAAIGKTIQKIELETNHQTIQRWKEIYKEEPVACVVCKIDTSELEILELHQRMPQFLEDLHGNGYGLYCIDYTQDFSGTLVRKALVGHLVKNYGMREQGDLSFAMEQDTPTILKNTDSVGQNVCTWVQTQNGKTTRTKVYNKIVANFEAGEVREQFGGHLADYANCSNEHLRKTFIHPDVQSRGCTRIEISMYACEDISPTLAEDTISEILEQVSAPIFVIQQPQQQWKNLASNIDRCTVLGDRPNGTIYMCWYAHTKTGRLSGVQISPTQANCEKDKNWNKAMEWTISEFGFRRCPIFRIDILEVDGQGMHLGPLRCYTKDAKTILTRSKKPTQIHTGIGDPSILLPDTNHISWQWRTTKTKNAIGIQKQTFEIDEISTNRKIAMLSTRDRAVLLRQLLEAQEIEIWKRQTQQLALEEQRARAQEIENIQHILQTKERTKQITDNIRNIVCQTFARTCKIERISTLPTNTRIFVLGFQYIQTQYGKSAKLVLQCENTTNVFWATTALYKAVAALEHIFGTTTYNKTQTYHALSEENILEFQTQEQRSFQKEGKTISYVPIVASNTNAPKEWRENIEKQIQEVEHLQNTLSTVHPNLQRRDPPKKPTKISDMPEGVYICNSFAQTTFWKKPRTILFLSAVDQDGNLQEEIPVCGAFLQQEVGNKNLELYSAPMRCRIGDFRFTKSRNKERTFACILLPLHGEKNPEGQANIPTDRIPAESIPAEASISANLPTKKECRAYKKRNKERVQIALQKNANSLAIVPEKTKEIQVLGFRILHTVQGKLAIFVARYKKIYEEGQINYCIDCDDVHSKDEDWCKPNHACENPFFAVQPFWGNQQILEYLESIVQNNFCLHYTKQGEKIFFFPSSNACPVFALSEIKTFSKDGETIACREVIGCKEDWVSKYQEIAHILG